jgi:hypothetical protein
LRSNLIIKKISAFALLVLFTFSMTPKLILHNLVANHKDTPYAASKEKNATLSVAGINCHCEDLVVTIPFISQPEPVYSLQPGFSTIRYAESISSFQGLSHFFFELRGPPSLA